MKGFKKLYRYIFNIGDDSGLYSINITNYHKGFDLTNSTKRKIENEFREYISKWLKKHLNSILEYPKKQQTIDEIIEMMEEFCDEVPTEYKMLFPKNCDVDVKTKDKFICKWMMNNGLVAIEITVS